MYIKKQRKFNRNEKGMSLVEVIAAFSITVVVLTSLVSLALFTLRSSLTSKLLLEGTKTAQREIELVRAFRDQSASWTQFRTDLNTMRCTCPAGAASCLLQCYMSTGGGVLQPVTGQQTLTVDNQQVTHFFNIIPDANDATNIVRVSVEVSWKIGSQTKSTHVYTDLTNWQPK